MLYAVDDTRMTAIGNAIRNKTGNTAKLSVDEMPNAINSISISTNMIYKVNYIADTYIDRTNGNTSTYGGWTSSDFITIPNGANSCFCNCNEYACFYDSNKRFLASWNKDLAPMVRNIPSGAKYFKTSTWTDQYNNLVCFFYKI